ncbi:unnamed protein product [Linum trigynum]|uniref:Uncharacterized protein n=1 Tax=Linum trigynum TaxID=586398 RepID=A0AAV2CDB7_9ROSI
MLSSSPYENLSSASPLPQAGRPPDIAILPSENQPQLASVSASPPLSYKNTLAGPSTNQSLVSKANQWTFVGEHAIELGSFGGEPELKISAKLKERLCGPWKKTLVVRLLGRSVSYNYLCS